jgi:hypothetical protein
LQAYKILSGAKNDNLNLPNTYGDNTNKGERSQLFKLTVLNKLFVKFLHKRV